MCGTNSFPFKRESITELQFIFCGNQLLQLLTAINWLMMLIEHTKKQHFSFEIKLANRSFFNNLPRRKRIQPTT